MACSKLSWPGRSGFFVYLEYSFGSQMKSVEKIIFWFPVIITFSCTQPTARFVTDKDQYYQGETVELKNTSLTGKSFVWTMPDGSEIKAKNASFALDPNDNELKKTFKLTAYSAMKSKKSETVRSVTITQGILESDFYSLETIGATTQVFKPLTKAGILDNNTKKNWLISAKWDDGSANNYRISGDLTVY